MKKIKVMGILNLTPDSFSDGGKYTNTKAAVAKAKEMEAAGADIIDIGGESTGPGSKNVKLKEELKRVIPTLRAIRKATALPISIDTYKSKVAKAALENGANIINDITALRGDKEMVKIARKFQCPLILMYSKDKSARTTIKPKNYKDIIQEVGDFLQERIAYARDHNIKKTNIILDPGMGQYISSKAEYSFEIIARLNQLANRFISHKILIGISRKSFIGGDIQDRDKKANLLTAIATLNGASIIRTHDVDGVRQTLNLINGT